MKFLLCCAFVGFLCYASAADSFAYDGEPGCRTPVEVGRAFRNLWDPTRYWRCQGLGQRAVSEHCMSGTAFDSSLGHCVPWADWVWQPVQWPPSRPDSVDADEALPAFVGVNTVNNAGLEQIY